MPTQKESEFIVGPIRVLPGRLSVCRTFGDPDAKLEYRGGNPNVVKAEPEIKTFQISADHDFIALASDGIFDKLTDKEVG
jgi:protein phosphatase PTC2/3